MKRIFLFFLMIMGLFIGIVEAETPDNEIPVINSITQITTDFVNNGKAEFMIDATDDVSGIDFIVLNFVMEGKSPSEYQYTFGILVRCGDSQCNGKKKYTGSVPNTVKEGDYLLFSVQINDKSNKTRYYVTGTPSETSEHKDFNFPKIHVSTVESDTEGPKLKKLTVSSNNVKVGETITFEATYEDESSITRVYLVLGRNAYDLHSAGNGVYRGTITFDSPGTYNFQSIMATDSMQNESIYDYRRGNSFVSAIHELEDGKYDIVVTDENGGTTPKEPTLKKLVLSKDKVKAPGTLTVKIYADKGLTLMLSLATDDETPAATITPVDKGWVKDHYEYELTIEQYSHKGTYYINAIHLINSAGVERVYLHNPDKYGNVVASEMRPLDRYAFEIVQDINPDISTSIDNVSLLDQIEKAKDKSVISVDTSSTTNIPKAFFEKLKGRDITAVLETKGIQWHFNGKDITNPKDIDVNVKIYRFDNYNDESGDIEEDFENGTNGLAIEFANNGVLPGKVLIKIKVDFALREYLGDDALTLYYKNNDGYDVIANNVVESNDEFFVFYIDHNSTYLLTNKKVNKNKIKNDQSSSLGNEALAEEQQGDVKNDDKEETNEKQVAKETANKKKSNKVKVIALTAVPIVLVIVIVIVVLIYRKKKSKV